MAYCFFVFFLFLSPAGQPNRVRIVRPVETAFKSFPLPSSVGSARTSVSPSASPNLVPATIADPAAPTSGGIVISPRSIYLSPPEPVDESAISATAAGSLLSPQYLLPWFPTAEERGLILHFCQHSATLLMARPVEAGVNPILATLLPLALSAPRGFSISTDALRLSLLAIAATHQAYLLSKSGTPGPVLSKSLDLAIGLRTDARVLARSADSKVQGDKGDALFAATVVLGIVDILLGGHAWTQNFDLAKAIVANRGGVEAMLAASASITLKEGVEVSRTRLLLESESISYVYITPERSAYTSPLSPQSSSLTRSLDPSSPPRSPRRSFPAIGSPTPPRQLHPRTTCTQSTSTSESRARRSAFSLASRAL